MSGSASGEPPTVTVGIDIGTTSVKAVAVDPDGVVVARTRVPHRLLASGAGELAHDAREAWYEGPRRALAELLEVIGPDTAVAAVNVSAMVPSLCAVDASGVPCSDGLLYGDARGAGGDPSKSPNESGELVRFLAALVRSHPDAAGYWPAQAVANAALGAPATIDTVTAMTTLPLFDFAGWDAEVAASAGLDDLGKLPAIGPGNEPIGRLPARPGTVIGPGTIDAFAEQLVADASRSGDVFVILGATLICWIVVDEWLEVPGLWTVPHTVPGKTLVGGPSNSGGLFVDWVHGLVGPPRDDDAAVAATPDLVPVWMPYLRGERVPLHDPARRASLSRLEIGMGPASVRRGAYEASGFTIRRMLELAGCDGSRIVATGGGTRNGEWLAALADASGLAVDVVAVSEGAALGTAFLARVAAGLEVSGNDASRWSRTGGRVEPAPAWADATCRRYEQFLRLVELAP